MNKEIKGSINYTIILTEQGYGIEYNIDIENNVATLLMAANITKEAISNLKEQKKILLGEKKKKVHEAIQRIVRAKYVIENMADDLVRELAMQVKEQSLSAAEKTQ